MMCVDDRPMGSMERFPPLTVGKLIELLKAEDPAKVVVIPSLNPRTAVHPVDLDQLAAATQVAWCGSDMILIDNTDENF